MERVLWSDYVMRVVSAKGQFDLARRALASLSSDSATLRTYLDPELGHTILKDSVRRDLTPETLADELKKFSLRLDQNELILSTALFETFMKDLLRALLLQAPRLLREDRQIALGRLVAQGMEEIVREEVEREVLALDRKSVQDRARYFAERLHVRWGPPRLVNRAQGTVSLRNQILHEKPDDPVPAKALDDVVIVAILVPGFACQDVAEHYPSILAEQDRVSFRGRPFDSVYDAMQEGS